jgi:HEAT repeat protein
MLTNEQLKTLARASAWWGEFEGELASKPFDERIRTRALEAMGSPGDETIVTSGLSALAHEDRNMRVAALRVLRWHLGDERVVDGVLQATTDDARRVRRIAVQLCALLVDRPAIAQRLREIVDDPNETAKISGTALGSLAGNALAGAPGSAFRSVSDLLVSDRFRERVLLLLLQQRLDDQARDLLQDVVRNGTKAEAVAATRALCGMRIVNLAHFPPDERKRIQATADPVDMSFVSSRAYVNASLYWISTER